MPRPAKRPPNRTDGRWEVKITLEKNTIDSKPIRKSFYSSISYDDAKRQANEYITTMEAHRLLGDALVQREATFDELAQLWLDHKESSVKYYTFVTTYKTKYDKYIKPFFGTRKVTDIYSSDVQKFFDKYKYLSSSMRKKFLLILKGVFDFAVDNDFCYKNPAKKIVINEKLIIKKNVYNQSEKDIFMRASKEKGYYDFVLLIETGIRRSELSITQAITPNIRYSKELSIKSNTSYRNIPISTDTADYLKHFISSGYVITNTNTPMSPEGYAHNFKKRMRELSSKYAIPELTPHELRYTFGTLPRENGADIYTISKAMGHSTIEITAKTYVKNDLEVLRKDMKIDNV